MKKVNLHDLSQEKCSNEVFEYLDWLNGTVNRSRSDFLLMTNNIEYLCWLKIVLERFYLNVKQVTFFTEKYKNNWL